MLEDYAQHIECTIRRIFAGQGGQLPIRIDSTPVVFHSTVPGEQAIKPSANAPGRNLILSKPVWIDHYSFKISLSGEAFFFTLPVMTYMYWNVNKIL